MNKRKVLEKALAGSRNIRFNDLVALVEALGFHAARVNGSHHLFKHPDIFALINLQDVNGQAKPYQAKQVLDIIETHGLSLDADEEQSQPKGEQEAP